MTGEHLVTSALNSVIVTIMLVVTTSMVPVETACVQQDGKQMHATKVFKVNKQKCESFVRYCSI